MTMEHGPANDHKRKSLSVNQHLKRNKTHKMIIKRQLNSLFVPKCSLKVCFEQVDIKVLTAHIHALYMGLKTTPSQELQQQWPKGLLSKTKTQPWLRFVHILGATIRYFVLNYCLLHAAPLDSDAVFMSL